jgi:thiamine monophosphate kinase
MAKTTHFSRKGKTAPVTHKGEQANVENGPGYFDLVINLNKKGTAIRIADKFNENRVHVTTDSVDGLIAALQHIKAANVKTSVKDVQYVEAA